MAGISSVRGRWRTCGDILARSLALVLAPGQAIAADGPAVAAAPAPAAAAPTANAAPSIPPLIPSSVFAERPFITDPRISPDGKRIAARFNIGSKNVIGFLDLVSGKPSGIAMADGDDLRWFRWAGSNTLLVSVGKSVPFDDDMVYSTRLMALDAATVALRFVGGKSEGITGDDVLWIDPEGQRVLMAYQETIYDYPGVFSVDLATNKATRVQAPKTGVWDWYADDKGVVRVGIDVGSMSGRVGLLYRAGPEDKFRTVLKARLDDDDAALDAVRIFQGSDEGFRVMTDEKTGRFALYKFNFATRERGELVYEHPTNDVDGFDTSDDGKSLTAAWFVAERPELHWFDPAMASIQASLDKSVGTRFARVVSRSREDRRMIVHVGSSHDPGSYYVFDRDEGVMHLVAPINKGLKPTALAPTQYVHYKARDGLELAAYLTLPRGRPAKNLPFVILPHGGPFDVRDEGDFDDDVQFLANRGYAVLQPHSRCSSSYGTAFYTKGEGQWGRAMQDDLDDGMDWLAKQGTIDPKRGCIVGSSYGGYAALWGVTRNPERYRCGASFAGISDLRKQLKYQLDFKISKRYRKDWRKAVQGDAQFDLKTVSPLYTVDRLTRPVLLVHGTKDPRVPFQQSKAYVDALRSAGKPVEYVEMPGEGHGFSKAANEQQWLDRLGAFMAKYNPAD